jgi:hypothetical protein
LDVAAEIGKVYRDCRHERIDAALGNRLASILSAMRQCLETAEFERRIAQIEAAVMARAGQSGQALVDSFAPLDDEDLPKSDRRH